MTILVGTSGFSYKDWVGPYYPEDLPKQDWLRYYAREFSTCELNFSYYHIPNQRTLTSIADKVPSGFLFSLKAFRGITHEREDPEPLVKQLTAALDPLREQEKFACILAQFPYSFHANEENRDYLRRLREYFGSLPVVVEFRSRDWITPRTSEELSQLNFGYCCVDQPRLRGLVPPVTKVTGALGYVRFHGRNAAKWWQHDEAWERYDYSYSEEELAEWAPKIRELDEEAPLTLVYMNNHWRGQSADDARQLRALLMKGE